MALTLKKSEVFQAPPLTSITGANLGGKSKVRSGKELFNGPRSVKIGVFGDPGTGKTWMLIKLLVAGQKVLVLYDDFGATGEDQTISNYLDNHPEHRELFENNLRIMTFDLKQFFQFLLDPSSIDGLQDVYEWDPDWIFFDGFSNYQMGTLEHEISGGDFLRKETDYSHWKQARNGTVFPLSTFLKLSNVKTGKPWSKIVTLLEDRKEKNGVEKVGPMLDTTARELASAGFDLVMRTIVRPSLGGGLPKHLYISAGADLMVKDRGFMPPGQNEILADDFWDQIIGPKLGWNTSK